MLLLGYKNNKVISYLLKCFNHISNINVVNQFTVSAFSDVSPPCEKTIINRLEPSLQDLNNLMDVLSKVGCFLFLVKGESIFRFCWDSIKAFTWIPKISKKIIDYSTFFQLLIKNETLIVNLLT